MILVVDRDPTHGTALAHHLAREGLPASAALSPPPAGGRLAVAVVCVREASHLQWLTELDRADRRLALVPTPLRIAAFERGADDVTDLVPGPDPAAGGPSLREVTLRVRNLYRRPLPDERPPSSARTEWLRPGESSLTIDGRHFQLSAAEFRLMELLAARPGRVVPRDRLLQEAWPPGTDPRTVDTTIKRLRSRLGARGRVIETVRGVGYRFNAVPAAE